MVAIVENIVKAQYDDYEREPFLKALCYLENIKFEIYKVSTKKLVLSREEKLCFDKKIKLAQRV